MSHYMQYHGLTHAHVHPAMFATEADKPAAQTHRNTSDVILGCGETVLSPYSHRYKRFLQLPLQQACLHSNCSSESCFSCYGHRSVVITLFYYLAAIQPVTELSMAIKLFQKQNSFFNKGQNQLQQHFTREAFFSPSILFFFFWTKYTSLS